MKNVDEPITFSPLKENPTYCVVASDIKVCGYYVTKCKKFNKWKIKFWECICKVEHNGIRDFTLMEKENNA